MQDLDHILLEIHRKDGFALFLVGPEHIFLTRKPKPHMDLAAVFTIQEGGLYPVKAIWTACDIAARRALIDYDKIDINDPEIRDKIEHGTLRGR